MCVDRLLELMHLYLSSSTDEAVYRFSTSSRESKNFWLD
jgi:hypothetical protein